MALVMCIWRQ